MENLTEILKGVLEGCVLEVISLGKTYGYEITQKLQGLGFSDVAVGTVYTILIRLEKAEFIAAEVSPSEIGPQRKFYSLTKSGREELCAFWAKWNFVSSKVNQLKKEK